MSDEIKLQYDESAKTATIGFPNGRKMRLSNVSEAQAKEFVERHAPEFQRRDCILHTGGGIQTREVAAHE